MSKKACQVHLLGSLLVVLGAAIATNLDGYTGLLIATIGSGIAIGAYFRPTKGREKP